MAASESKPPPNPLVCNFCLGQMVLWRVKGKIKYFCEECGKDENGNLR